MTDLFITSSKLLSDNHEVALEVNRLVSIYNWEQPSQSLADFLIDNTATGQGISFDVNTLPNTEIVNRIEVKQHNQHIANIFRITGLV